MNNVLYVPSVHRNLIFVPMLDKKVFKIKIKSSCVFIIKGDISVSGVKVDGMYLLKCDNNKDFIYDYLNVLNALNNTCLWHLRLGHINKQKMMRMSKSGLIHLINLDDFHTCEPCIKRKMTSKPFSKCWKSSDLLEVVHSDICGPLRTKTHQGMEYFITFMNNYSKYKYVYLLKYKSGAVEKFKEF